MSNQRENRNFQECTYGGQNGFVLGTTDQRYGRRGKRVVQFGRFPSDRAGSGRSLSSYELCTESEMR